MAVHLEIALQDVDGGDRFVFGTGPGTSGAPINQATPTPSTAVYRRTKRAGRKPKLWLDEVTPERLSVTGAVQAPETPSTALDPMKRIAERGTAFTINRAKAKVDNRLWVVEDFSIEEPYLIEGLAWEISYTLIFVEDPD